MRHFLSFSKMVFFFLILLYGCTGSSLKNYEIGVDPSWYPLNFQGRDPMVLGFSTELLQKVTEEEHLTLSLLSTNWDTLFSGLKEQKYQAILSSLYPYTFYQDQYDFSELYLAIGPVLLVKTSSLAKDLHDLQEKEVGILEGSTHALLLEKDPSILIRTFTSPPELLNALVQEQVDAALLPILLAEAYLQDLYQGKIHIISEPLTKEGLRLIALKGKAGELIHAFNQTLSSMQKTKEYEKLLAKWQLGPSL